MRILMVCLGNICRSPLAEGIMKEKINIEKLGWLVDSAGTNGLHNGEAPHYLSQKVAKLHGIDISKQRSRKFVLDDFENYDVIFAMANDVMDGINRMRKTANQKNKVQLFLHVANPNKNEDVPDPWYGGEEGYHEVYKIIDEGCTAIIEKFKV
jgi:protein-tyrosine phosphatase